MPFDIPNSWCWVRFSSLIKVISGVSYDKHDVCNKGIRILRGGNIKNFNVSVEDDDVFLPEDYYDEEKQVQVNDILVVASTGSKLAIGKAGYIIEELENTQIGAFLRIVRPLVTEFAEYIKTIFATSYYKEHILDSIRGSNINNLKNEHISNLLIPLPPIDEQLRMVKYIKEIFSQIDLIENNQSEYDSLVESLKKAILQAAIQGTLIEQCEDDEPASVLLEHIREEKRKQFGKKYVESYIFKGDDNRYYEKIGTKEPVLLENLPFEIPSSWSWARLGTIIDFSKSLTVKVDAIKDTDWVLDLEDIEKDTGKVLVKKTMIETKSKSDKHKFFAGNVLYSKLRPYLNKVLIADEDGYCTTEILAFDFGKYIVNHYARYFLMSSYFLDYATNGALGDMPRIRSSLGNNGLMPIPPYNEQIRICTRIKHILDSIKDEA